MIDHDDHQHANKADLSHHFDTSRLEAFSDGVFAIAITLLIIEVGVPHITAGESLAHALWQQWPSYFGFALSFVAIGIMWMNHHAMFRDIERVDQTVLVLNILLLMAVSFLPFPTAVLADYLRDGNSRLAATLLYGGTLVTTAVWFNALWLYASIGRRLIDEHVSDRRIQQRTWRFLLGPAVYGLSLILAFVSPWISLWLYVGLALLYFLPISETDASS
ncbi:MAG TPA: TMEM175 family protein [Dehalococcoidia bacterium]|nr:TMEM175 family protein [Dehalococcoidia bacterium]